MKYDEASGALLDYTSQVTFSGNTAVVHLADGGPGDADGVVNGRIIDPGGPAIGNTAASGGGGGGCTLATHDRSDTGLWLLLATLMVSRRWQQRSAARLSA